MEKNKEVIDYEENIRNYGDQIISIDSFIEGVRKLPGMYIGNIGNNGYLGCTREIFQNAVDEEVKKDSPCHNVIVTYDERDHKMIVEDDGRGIPHTKIISTYSNERTSSNYIKKPGEYSSGTHGVGSGVALALSEYFEVDSYVLGKAKQVKFTKGIPWDKGELDIPCPKGRQGTTVILTPDESILGPITLTAQDVFDMVFAIFPLINIGDRIMFTGINKHGDICIQENMINKDGIITVLILKTQTPLIAPIMFKDDNGITKAEIAFTYDSKDLTSIEDVTSYSNFTSTTGGGSHLNGFIEGLCNFFRNYMNKIYLGEKSKLTVVNGDIKTGLKAVINAAHLNPIFGGQAKATLSNEDMRIFIRDLTYHSLENWSRSSPADMQKLCKYFKDIAEIRVKSDDNKIKLSNQYDADILTGQPKKYVQPSGHKDLELFIVEGDSAMGSAQNSRDPSRQGLFPIRGKLANAFKMEKTKFLKNEEIASIIKIVGGGYGKSFDISKVKWDKIVIMADADADGSHINTLLLRLFLLYMPEIITSGKLYKAVPPLYGLQVGKKKIYFTNTIEKTKYVQSIFNKTYTLFRIGGRALTANECTDLFYKNEDYSYLITILARTFATEPYLLEYILYLIYPYLIKNKNTMDKVKGKNSEIPVHLNGAIHSVNNYTINFNKLPFNKIKNSIENYSRFIKVNLMDNTIIIEGLHDSKTQKIFLNEKFLNACSKFFDLVALNDSLYYSLNGEKTSVLKIMNIFNNVVPKLERYKGLGEQDPKDLGISTLRPDSNRTLIQYTIEGVQDQIQMIRYIDSNRSMLLTDIGNIKRQDIE